MVGQRTLNPLILVRVQVSQQQEKRPAFAGLFSALSEGDLDSNRSVSGNEKQNGLLFIKLPQANCRH